MFTIQVKILYAIDKVTKKLKVLIIQLELIDMELNIFAMQLEIVEIQL